MNLALFSLFTKNHNILFWALLKTWWWSKRCNLKAKWIRNFCPNQQHAVIRNIICKIAQVLLRTYFNTMSRLHTIHLQILNIFCENIHKLVLFCMKNKKLFYYWHIDMPTANILRRLLCQKSRFEFVEWRMEKDFLLLFLPLFDFLRQHK